MAKNNKLKRKVILSFQFAIMLCAFIYIGFLVDWPKAQTALGQANLRYYAIAFCLALLALFPAALRWIALLKSAEIPYSLLSAYRAYLSGAFIGVAMPGVVGGDVVRVWLCIRDTKANMVTATASVLLERALGVGALLIILSAGLYQTDFETTNEFFQYAPYVAGAGLLSITLLPFLIRWIAVFQSRSSGNTTALIRIVQKLVCFQSLNIAGLYLALLLSLIFQLFDVFVCYFISESLGYPLNPVNLMVALPVAYLITVLPLSPGGLGVREATFVAILGLFGMSPNEAALLALAIFLNRVLIGLVGGINFASDYSSFRKAIRE